MARVTAREFKNAVYKTTDKTIIFEAAKTNFEYKGIINEFNMSRSKFTMDIYATLGLMKPTGELEQYNLDEIMDVGEYTVRPIKFTNGIYFSEEFLEDNEVAQLQRQQQMLVRSYKNTTEMLGHLVYNEAFNTAYPTWDGQPLISNAHPIDRGATNSNLVNSDLSATALHEAVLLYKNMLDFRGVSPINNGKPAMLVVSDDLEDDAIALLEMKEHVRLTDHTEYSDLAPYLYSSIRGLKVVGSRWITDSDAWFVVSPKSEIDAGLWWRKKFSVKKPVEITEEGGIAFYSSMRVGVGIQNYNWIVGSPGV